MGRRYPGRLGACGRDRTLRRSAAGDGEGRRVDQLPRGAPAGLADVSPDRLGSMAVDDARSMLRELVDRQQQLNRESVIPSTTAWKKAKSQLEGGSQAYKADI